MNIEEIKELRLRANEIRRLSIDMIYGAQSGHPGGSLSAADILVTLYFKIMKVDPANPQWPDRDRFVLSKGHASAAYYAVLALKGYFPMDELKNFRKINSMLQGHPTIHVPGVDMTTGSLGQGFSTSLGMALAGKIDGKDYHVYTLVGDGEMDEGIVWEAAINAVHNKLDNLIMIVDRNMYQLDGNTEKILSLGEVSKKLEAFGWEVREIDGHSITEIYISIMESMQRNGKPKAIVARTVKGKGVSYMQNTHEFHGKPPNKEQYEKAIKELEEEKNRIMSE
ncbi:MAG: transketolase [Thermoplasmata archaeon]